MDYILARLSERTTWAGIFTGLGLIGINVSTGFIEQAATAGVAVVSAYLIYMKEKKK